MQVAEAEVVELVGGDGDPPNRHPAIKDGATRSTVLMRATRSIRGQGNPGAHRDYQREVQ